MALINVKNIHKNYINKKRTHGIKGFVKDIFLGKNEIVSAINNISFTIDEGEIVGYIGPNGAGKSTTIKMLTGILVPSSGEIEINGIIPYKQRRDHVKNIGVVFGQRSQLWWDLPVEDSFSLLKDIYKIPDNVYHSNISMFIDALNIGDILRKPVRQLSLGQRMKCEISASFLHNPKIVFLDEPTIGLDIIAKEQIRNVIKYLNKEKKVTILLTTHDMSDIEDLCSRIMIIDKGKLVYDGDLRQIKNIYGQTRILIVDFKDDVTLDMEGIKVIEDSGKRKKLSFQIDNIPMNDVLSYLSLKSEIKDIEIISTPIENIIKDIYNSN